MILFLFHLFLSSLAHKITTSSSPSPPRAWRSALISVYPHICCCSSHTVSRYQPASGEGRLPACSEVPLAMFRVNIERRERQRSCSWRCGLWLLTRVKASRWPRWQQRYCHCQPLAGSAAICDRKQEKNRTLTSVSQCVVILLLTRHV